MAAINSARQRAGIELPTAHCAVAARNESMTCSTPAVLVDYERLLENIRAVQRKADAAGVAVRPHIKTHKSLEIATLQIREGAVGITASKVDEALVFVNAG